MPSRKPRPEPDRHDPQLVELRGRNHLTNELLRAGIEVALPLRDRGVDLVAYLDSDLELGRFVGRPVQLKAATDAAFNVEEKYRRFPELILAYVWHLGDPHRTVVYAMSYAETLAIARAYGWDRKPSWRTHKGWSVSRPSQHLRDLLDQRYRMDPARWKHLVRKGSMRGAPEVVRAAGRLTAAPRTALRPAVDDPAQPWLAPAPPPGPPARHARQFPAPAAPAGRSRPSSTALRRR
jgi:hypothetical protein